MVKQEQQYNSLLEIRARKAELKSQIDVSGEEIRGIWNGMFHQPSLSTLSPTQRFLSIVSSSAGIIDGALFGWKLYRKFKK